MTQYTVHVIFNILIFFVIETFFIAFCYLNNHQLFVLAYQFIFKLDKKKLAFINVVMYTVHSDL